MSPLTGPQYRDQSTVVCFKKLAQYGSLPRILSTLLVPLKVTLFHLNSEGNTCVMGYLVGDDGHHSVGLAEGNPGTILTCF